MKRRMNVMRRPAAWMDTLIVLNIRRPQAGYGYHERPQHASWQCQRAGIEPGPADVSLKGEAEERDT